MKEIVLGIKGGSSIVSIYFVKRLFNHEFSFDCFLKNSPAGKAAV
jgi:hypothetical protein